MQSPVFQVRSRSVPGLRRAPDAVRFARFLQAPVRGLARALGAPRRPLGASERPVRTRALRRFALTLRGMSRSCSRRSRPRRAVVVPDRRPPPEARRPFAQPPSASCPSVWSGVQRVSCRHPPQTRRALGRCSPLGAAMRAPRGHRIPLDPKFVPVRRTPLRFEGRVDCSHDAPPARRPDGALCTRSFLYISRSPARLFREQGASPAIGARAEPSRHATAPEFDWLRHAPPLEGILGSLLLEARPPSTASGPACWVCGRLARRARRDDCCH
jgi:hypothetical protein